MKKLFFMALALLSTVSLAVTPKSQLFCYSGNRAYVITTPKGFVRDEEAGKKLGVCAIYYPAGSTFDNAAIAIYPNFAKKNVKDEPIGMVIERDLKEFTAPGMSVTPAKLLETKVGKWQIVDLLNGPVPNEFERMGYLDGQENVFLLVMSAHNLVDFKKYEKEFASIMQTLRYEDKADIFAAQIKQAKLDEKSKGGKAYIANYVKPLTPVLDGAVESCFGKNKFEPFTAIFQIVATGELREVLLNKASPELDCFRQKLIGHMGAKPPRVPFSIHFTMNSK